MPKVLRIINRFNLGGPTYNVAYLTKYLAPEFETLLVGGEKEASEASSNFILEDLGVMPQIIPSMKRAINPLNDFNSYRSIKKIIRDFKPDIVHTHAAKAGTIGRLAAIECRVPIVLHTFHGNVLNGYFGKAKTVLFKTIERQLALRSSGIIAISDLQKQELVETHKIAPASKAFVIPLGFDLSRFQISKEEKRLAFRKRFNIETDELAIGIVGRLVPIKNHQLFLKAIARVEASSSKKIRSFIIGDGEEKEPLKAIAKELGLSTVESVDHPTRASVTFTSWIKEVDIALSGLDIVCLTSINEGTPVSLIEAQANGTPLVSTKVGGIENIVWENKTGLLAPIGDDDLFFKQLLRLVEEDALREELSKNGWDFVKNTFHYTRLVADMRNLYNSLLGI